MAETVHIVVRTCGGEAATTFLATDGRTMLACRRARTLYVSAAEPQRDGRVAWFAVASEIPACTSRSRPAAAPGTKCPRVPSSASIPNYGCAGPPSSNRFEQLACSRSPRREGGAAPIGPGRLQPDLQPFLAAARAQRGSAHSHNVAAGTASRSSEPSAKRSAGPANRYRSRLLQGHAAAAVEVRQGEGRRAGARR